MSGVPNFGFLCTLRILVIGAQHDGVLLLFFVAFRAVIYENSLARVDSHASYDSYTLPFERPMLYASCSKCFSP